MKMRSQVQFVRRLLSDPAGLFADAAASGKDVVAFRAAHRLVFLVIGPEPLARVTRSNSLNYRKGISYDALKIPLADSLLTIDGYAAAERRRLLSPLFTRRSVATHIPAMVAAVEDCCRRWDAFAAGGAVVDIAAEMNRLAFDMIGRVLLGAELGPSMAELERAIDDAGRWVARRTRALLPLPPTLPTPRNRAFRRDDACIRTFIQRLIAQHRHGAPDDSFLSLLLSEENGKVEPDDKALCEEMAGFLMAGHQTTAASLAWTWDLLARHPDVLRRVEAEVDAAPSLHDQCDLEHLGYVGQVVRESMRLYPPGWAFTRAPVEDDELDGQRVSVGANIVICSYANQRSPRFWSEPERFDPERFASGVRAPETHRYFPFGIGSRACIGRHLSLVEEVLCVALLTRRYRLRPLSDAPVPVDAGITLRPAAPIMARIERR